MSVHDEGQVDGQRSANCTGESTNQENNGIMDDRVGTEETYQVSRLVQ